MVRKREEGEGRERKEWGAVIDAVSFLLTHRLIGWGQIRRGVIYKPSMSSEGGTTT